MDEAPLTRSTLLLRIRNARDDCAWTEFVDIYAPVVYGYACKKGLQPADAADLTQDVLTNVARVAGRFHYDPRRGSFRSWLFTVAANQVRKFYRSRKVRDREHNGPQVETVLAKWPDPSAEQDEWDRDYQARLLEWASGQAQHFFQAATWQAFWQTSVDGRPPQEVAETLGLSVGAVYIARSRVLARLKQIIEQFDT